MAPEMERQTGAPRSGLPWWDGLSSHPSIRPRRRPAPRRSRAAVARRGVQTPLGKRFLIGGEQLFDIGTEVFFMIRLRLLLGIRF